MSQDQSQLNHGGALSENHGKTEDVAGTLENMEPGVGSGDGQGPNEQGGSPSSSSSSSSWFGSTVTGLLGMQQGSEHAEIDAREEEEEAKAVEARNSLASSMTQWLGYGEQSETDAATLGQDEEGTEKGDTDSAFTLNMNSWLSYGNEGTEDPEKGLKTEIEEEKEEEKKEPFRSRKLALDLESQPLQEEELAVPGTFDWLGDSLSSTIGFGTTHQVSGLEKKMDKEEVESNNKDVKPSPSHSWNDLGIEDVLGFGKTAGKLDSTVESGWKAEKGGMEKHAELQSIETSPSRMIQDMREPTNIHNVDTSLSPPPPSLPQQQPGEYDIITDNRVEINTKVLVAGVNSEEDSVSNTNDFPLEQSREESPIETDLIHTLSLNGNSDIDDVSDSIRMLITDNQSEGANLDEDKALQIRLEKDPKTDPSRDSFLSKLDNVLSLDQVDVYQDNEKEAETKKADENVSAQTKDENDPDLTQYSLENDEGSVETVFDGKADEHEEDKTETGTLNPGVAPTNTAGDQIFASTQFHDTMQQNHNNMYSRDGKETVQATEDGRLNTFEAEELNSSQLEALSDNVARKTEATETNEMNTHIITAATQDEHAVELRTDAALHQLSSKEAGIFQHTLRYSERQSEENKISLTSHDVLAGIVDGYTNMDTIDQPSGLSTMAGSRECSGDNKDGDHLDHFKIGAVLDEEHPVTEALITDGGAVFDSDNYHASAEPNNPKSTTVENSSSDTVRKIEGKEIQERDEETEIVEKLQVAISESLDPAIKNHSSWIRDNESEVRATESMKQEQNIMDEPYREGESKDGPTNKFQPDNIDPLYSGVATFPEPSINEMTESNHQSDITDQVTTIVEEGENVNSDNYDLSITEQTDSMVANSNDISTSSASHNDAVISVQAVVVDSLKPDFPVENNDKVRPESLGGAFGVFKNAFSYFSPTPSAENSYLKPISDSSGIKKTFKPEGSLNSEQVTHVIADTTPGKGIVPDTPVSSNTLQLPHLETPLPLPSAQYQSQSSSYFHSNIQPQKYQLKKAQRRSPKNPWPSKAISVSRRQPF